MINIEKLEGTETVTRIGDAIQFWKDKGKSRYDAGKIAKQKVIIYLKIIYFYMVVKQ